MNTRIIGAIVVVVAIIAFVVVVFSINGARPTAGNGATREENVAAGVPENAAADAVQ